MKGINTHGQRKILNQEMRNIRCRAQLGLCSDFDGSDRRLESGGGWGGALSAAGVAGVCEAEAEGVL